MSKPTASQVRAVVSSTLAAVGFEPCGDNSCHFGPPGGMATNGGCRCVARRETTQDEDRLDLKRLARAVRVLAEQVARREGQ